MYDNEVSSLFKTTAEPEIDGGFPGWSEQELTVISPSLYMLNRHLESLRIAASKVGLNGEREKTKPRVKVQSIETVSKSVIDMEAACQIWLEKFKIKTGKKNSGAGNIEMNAEEKMGKEKMECTKRDNLKITIRIKNGQLECGPSGLVQSENIQNGWNIDSSDEISSEDNTDVSSGSSQLSMDIEESTCTDTSGQNSETEHFYRNRSEPLEENGLNQSSVPKEERSFECHSCKNSFPSEEFCRNHIRSGCSLPFCCVLCEKRFNSRSKLLHHHSTHSGVQPRYRCEYPRCGKFFTTSSHYATHKRIHATEKSYRCHHPGCERSFVREDILLKHVRTHSGDKPYCRDQPSCEKAFARADTKMFQDHTGERSHDQPRCGHSIIQRGSVIITHKRTHIENVPYIRLHRLKLIN